MADWISVHDETPPKGSRVLVLMDDNGKTSMMVANYGESGFWLPVYVPGKLTHWMMMDEKEATWRKQ